MIIRFTAYIYVYIYIERENIMYRTCMYIYIIIIKSAQPGAPGPVCLPKRVGLLWTSTQWAHRFQTHSYTFVSTAVRSQHMFKYA